MKSQRMLAPVLVIFIVGSASTLLADGEKGKKSKTPLQLSKGILCLEIRGFGDFDPRATPELTRDDKLLIYCEPSGHTIAPDKDKGYRAHITTEGRVRKKGKKETLFSRKMLLDYAPAASYPPRRIYLRTDVDIKGLGPGEYEFDLTVHDVLGDDRTVTQSIPFTVVAKKPEADKEKSAPGKSDR